MNISELFKMQQGLDEKIVLEKGLHDENLLPKRRLALLCELGELANEWRGFKFWSKDQKPRTKVFVKYDGKTLVYKNPLLEEYVDCLHFILSIGIAEGFNEKELLYFHEHNVSVFTESNIETQFLKTFEAVIEFYGRGGLEEYQDVLLYFVALGELLGFTWEQITEAYMAKNQINHDRQATGY